MTHKTGTLPEQLSVNYPKFKKKKTKNFKIIITFVFNYCTTLWTDITKILGEKVRDISNLALIILFIISKRTGKRSPTGINHCSCFNPPPLISWVAQIQDTLSPLSDAASHCGTVRRSKQHKGLCLPQLHQAADRPTSRVLPGCTGLERASITHLENEAGDSTGRRQI